ncbi:MAG: HAAAP family serine/threonine permease [Succinivibrio sp.]|nr:HAAAP family serine/threonine permease [Succinivibrio sp.]
MKQQQKQTGILTKFNLSWIVNLFGTAIGAGILYLPLTAGAAGMWPLLVLALLSWPLTYCAHLALARLVLAGSRADGDLTTAADEFFGRRLGTVITVLYFLSIYPILMVYVTGITNIADTFLTAQLELQLPRLLLSALCVAAFILLILLGERRAMAINDKLIYPLCLMLLVLSVYLIPHWNLSQLSYLPGAGEMLTTLWVALPVVVFSFSHAPAISAFAMSERGEYGNEVSAVVPKIMRLSTSILVGFIMFFVISCVLALTPQELSEAREQNETVLTYMGAHFDHPALAMCAPLIAFLAIATSFLGHYLGAREGLNSLIVRLSPAAAQHSPKRERGMALFFFLTLWAVAYLNPNVLSLIVSLCVPVLALILFILPMYAIHKIPALSDSRGRMANVFVTVIGLITIAALVAGL